MNLMQCVTSSYIVRGSGDADTHSSTMNGQSCGRSTTDFDFMVMVCQVAAFIPVLLEAVVLLQDQPRRPLCFCPTFCAVLFTILKHRCSFISLLMTHVTIRNNYWKWIRNKTGTHGSVLKASCQMNCRCSFQILVAILLKIISKNTALKGIANSLFNQYFHFKILFSPPMFGNLERIEKVTVNRNQNFSDKSQKIQRGDGQFLFSNQWHFKKQMKYKVFLHRTLSRVWHAFGKSMKTRTVCRVLHITSTSGIMNGKTNTYH